MMILLHLLKMTIWSLIIEPFVSNSIFCQFQRSTCVYLLHSECQVVDSINPMLEFISHLGGPAYAALAA